MVNTMKSLIYAVGILVVLYLLSDGAFKQISAQRLDESIIQVSYPESYRGWTRVKSMVILKGHENYDAFGGFHHIYANAMALGSLKKGESFPTGSVLVFELFREIIEDSTISEGNRLVVGVMEKDKIRFEATAGWGFEDFKVVNGTYERAVTNASEQCLSCHSSQKANDYVYSSYKE